jgi:hypothetical protein
MKILTIEYASHDLVNMTTTSKTFVNGICNCCHFCDNGIYNGNVWTNNQQSRVVTNGINIVIIYVQS